MSSSLFLILTYLIKYGSVKVSLSSENLVKSMVVTKKQCIVFLLTICAIVFFLSFDSSPSVAMAQRATQTDVVEKQIVAPIIQQQIKGKFEYIEISESCNFNALVHCTYAYSGPGLKYEKVYELENGMMFKIKNKVERNGQTWYHVRFDEKLRNPEVVVKDWYIPASSGRVVTADGEQVLSSSTPATPKRIVVDLSLHMIYAYDGDTLFLTTKVSDGVDSAPTPEGNFTIYKKTPSRYMQGPIAGVTDVPFDLPGVPWNLYFTEDGVVIHGAYWHNRYGTKQSSGCINLPPELAKILYDWAPLNTTVTIQN